MAENATSDERVLNRARIVEIDGKSAMWSWIKYAGITIEQAAIQFASDAMDDPRSCGLSVVVEVERDGVSHLIRVDKVVTYRTTGLRGGD